MACCRPAVSCATALTALACPRFHAKNCGSLGISFLARQTSPRRPQLLVAGSRATRRGLAACAGASSNVESLSTK